LEETDTGSFQYLAKGKSKDNGAAFSFKDTSQQIKIHFKFCILKDTKEEILNAKKVYKR